MTIKARLVALLLVPLLALTIIGGRSLLSLNSVVGEMAKVSELSDLAVHVSSLVHECQKERGMTAGFIGSNGEKFASELPTQRTNTDQKIQELHTFLEGFEATNYDTSLQESFSNAMTRLEQISTKRQSITALQLPLSDALAYYTGMNGVFLDSIATMTAQSSNASLSSEIAAYVNFLKSKERAGVERAVLTGTFAKDAFEPGMYKKFSALVSAQDSFMDSFLAMATDEAKSQYQNAAAQTPFAKVREYRAIADEKMVDGQFGVDPNAWFSTCTAKINILKETEDWLSATLITNSADIRSGASTQRAFMAFFVILIIGVVACGGIWTIKSITKPIAATIKSLNIIAEGDLTERLDAGRKDEMGQIAHAANQMGESLSELIREVTRASGDVAAAATEVAASSEEMAAGMDEQTGHVSLVTAAVEEMSVSVIEVARKSGEAANQAKQSSDEATQGGEVVGQTVTGIESIANFVNNSARAVESLGQKSEEIGQIIETINDIADQTNLLALNAAIEAARAGEHGRGFAVVADEVRKLAERTQQATEEVGKSISEIQEETKAAVEGMDGCRNQVGEGVKLAQLAGSALSTIVGGSDSVAAEISDIAAAADEQSTAVESISQSVEQINAVARQGAEGAGQGAIAAAQLSSHAEQLQSLVTRFRVD